MSDPSRDEKSEPESTPHGPHPNGIDEASGGADSSSFEALPSGEKAPAARKDPLVGEPPPR